MSKFFKESSESSESSLEDEEPTLESAEAELIKPSLSPNLGPVARMGSANTQLDASQHSNMLYVALIEDRCSEKASVLMSLPRSNPNVNYLSHSNHPILI